MTAIMCYFKVCEITIIKIIVFCELLCISITDDARYFLEFSSHGVLKKSNFFFKLTNAKHILLGSVLCLLI